MTTTRLAPRTALFLPASNPRAIEKARELGPDMVVLDLEDAVKPADKDSARAAAVEAVATGFGGRMSAIRVNGFDADEFDADVAAVAASRADYAVAPKAEDPAGIARLVQTLGKPLLVMIETPRGVLAAAQIAEIPGVVALVAGTNDLAASLRLPASSGRDALSMSLQTIVLAARAGGVWAIDGVFNQLDDPEGLGAECRHGHALGFEGKSLIHPNQIEIANAAFGPSPAETAEARALVDAATGGAERFRDRMIESMHVERARDLLARAERTGSGHAG